MIRPQHVLALVLAFALTACGLFETAAAVVNGRKVEREQFEATVRFVLADPQFAEQLAGEEGAVQRKDLVRQLLSFLIQVELLEAFAETEGIEVSEQQVNELLDQQIAARGGKERFREQLEQAEASEEEAKTLIRGQVLSEAVANAVVRQELTGAKLKAEYERRITEFTEVHAAHILVGSRGEAEDILGRVTPRNFARLARGSSLDQGSAADGGDLGTRPAADFVGPFAEAVSRIPVGEIGGPVETEFGFHVIRVLERDATPFSEARDRLVEETRGQVFNDWLLEQLQTAEIRVNPRYGAFDRETGRVIERRSTTPEPSPVQVEP